MTLATSPSNAFASLIAILVLAVVHLFVSELTRLPQHVRTVLLAAAAGASLSYVLLRILPKLAEKQDALLASAETGLRGFLEHHAYIVAMIGILVYYGISNVAARSASRQIAGVEEHWRGALLATAVAYTSYSLLIAYLIVNRLHFGLFSLSLITVGMATLFVGTDYSLFKKSPRAYESWMKWLLSAGLLSGWVLGVLVVVSANILTLWYALLAGLMLVSTIREKMSLDGVGAYRSFLAGVIMFTGAVLLLEHLAPGKV